MLTINADSAVGYTGMCMTASERAEWDARNEASGPSRAVNPCEDCTPEFHKEMRAAGACGGTPVGADPRKVRAAVKTKWDDPEWSAKRRKQMSEAAGRRNQGPELRRRRRNQYAGQRCQHDPCRAEPVSTSGFTGRMLCRKHSNLEAYHRNKAKRPRHSR